MGLFSSIKNAFGQTIVLDANKKTSLVVRQPLKNDMLKLNAEIDVEDGFDAMLCHYDSVCDCLSSGKYKFNDINMPRLSKFVKPRKTKKGMVSPKSIPADIYYVNKSLLEGLTFKTFNKFKAMHNSKVVKIKVLGSFDLRVVDSSKFVTAMLMDYAVLKDDKVKRELGDYVAYAIIDISNKLLFSVDEFNTNGENLINKLTELINKKLVSIGVEVNNIKITKVLMPRSVAVADGGVATTDPRIDDIFNTAYGSPIPPDDNKSVESKVEVRQKVLAGMAEETPSVINLGYAGSVPISSTPRPTAEEEYERATEDFAKLNNETKSSTLVFIDEKSEKVQTLEPTAPQKQESDIMLGRSTIPAIDAFKQPEIEDPFVQRQRKKDIEHLKESIEDKIERPKVMKASKNICKYCSNKLSPKDAFCPKCGKSTKNIKYCKACGEENDDSSLICKICGSKM